MTGMVASRTTGACAIYMKSPKTSNSLSRLIRRGGMEVGGIKNTGPQVREPGKSLIALFESSML